MKEKLTREKALNLHRRMWVDMLLKLGNNPDGLARTMFKLNWVRTHGYEDVECNCFLCEYDTQQRRIKENRDEWCKRCPIDWSSLSAKEEDDWLSIPGEEVASCGDRYIHSNYDSYESIWRSAPISEILNLPEKKGV
jgi:hypothetical protein